MSQLRMPRRLRPQLPEALDLIQKAVNLDPTNGSFLDSLGWAYFQMGKTDDAIGELEAAAKLSPNEPVLHFELGYLYYKKADYQRALPEFQSETRNNPGYAQAYVYLGDIAFRSNDKPLVENTNRWIRWFVPKRTDLRMISAQQIQHIEDWLNNVPRQCLDFATAREVALEQEGLGA